MHCHLAPRIEEADNDVGADPHDRKPTRPVISAEHEYAANNHDKLDNKNPSVRSAKGVLLQFVQVECGSAHAHSHQQPTDDSNSQWTLVH